MKRTQHKQQEAFEQGRCIEMPVVKDWIIRDESGRPVGYIDETTRQVKRPRQGEISWKEFFEAL